MTVFQRILVPVDFTPASEEAIEAGTAVCAGEEHVEISEATRRAVKLAADIARQSNGKLYIVHATPPMQLGTIYTGPVGVPAQVVDDIHARARKASLEAMSALRHLLCDDVKAAFDARPGHPITFVIAEAKQVKADLIVLAASGRSRVSRFFVGSTADRVIREAPCPVLVVPASPEDLED
jgi:nucleotide-binding universal stress UspA family protein